MLSSPLDFEAVGFDDGGDDDDDGDDGNGGKIDAAFAFPCAAPS